MKTDKRETFYVKRRGKFEPVGVIMETCSWPKGEYLVRIRNHSTSMRAIRTVLDIDDAKVEVAMSAMADAIACALGKANEAVPRIRKNTPRELKAVAAYKKILAMRDDEELTLWKKSYNDVAYEAMTMVRQMLGKKTPCPEGLFDVLAEKEAK